MCHQEWKTCVKEKKKVLFINFKGNHFNIVFYCAQVIFYHHDRVTDFLQNVHGPTNLLLQRILNSMKSDINLSCCRVMGLIAKLITSPFC